MLGLVIAFLVARIIDGILGLSHMIFYVYGPVACLLWLATIVPSVAVAVRRLHDTGRSGWWVLLPTVPYALAMVLGGPAVMAGGFGAGLGLAGLLMLVGMVCGVVLLVFMVLPGQPGDNQYGPDPYGEGAGGTVAAG